MVYGIFMFEIIKSETFERWLLGLKDRVARARVQARIDCLAAGNPGDAKPVREGIRELRIDYGPGYRVPGLFYQTRPAGHRAPGGR
jgi:putative addiction module killer protein